MRTSIAKLFLKDLLRNRQVPREVVNYNSAKKLSVVQEVAIEGQAGMFWWGPLMRKALYWDAC